MMKTGRLIKINSPKLRKIRNNLRSLLLTAVKESFHEIIDKGEGQLLFRNLFRVQQLDKEANIHYDLLFNTICKCKSCNSNEKDAVFVHYSFIDQFVYPPLGSNDNHSSSFWVCPDCYKDLIDKIEYFKKEKYYYLRDYCTFDSLNNLGIKNLDEIKKLESDF
ncbi:hypothetical protein LCGC14_1049690 [marine sediment metagenome]|uniref:Uncharacterized protein n=1 Tax=marine sediment metagenome TaxID=412755 RepID=A0A0F9Q7A4_9ZZZZ